MFKVIILILFDAYKAVLILARGNSKGIRLKNIRTVGGVSLITRAVTTVKSAGLLDVTVSTDHPLVALESIKSGANIFHRSYVTATDWAPSIWGTTEFLSSRPNITILILLQVTSPFVKASHIRLALRRIENPTPYDCVFSVTRSHKLRWQRLNNSMQPLNFNISSRPRRQDWKGELIESGAFYIARRELIELGTYQNNNCTVVEVSNAESLEVDSEYDLALANILLSSNLL